MNIKKEYKKAFEPQDLRTLLHIHSNYAELKNCQESEQEKYIKEKGIIVMTQIFLCKR